LHNVVVPKTQYRIALTAHPRIPLLIISHLFRMLTAVELNYQPVLQACKIYNVTADWFLPFEFITHEAMCSQVIPQPLFGFSLVGAQGFGVA